MTRRLVFGGLMTLAVVALVVGTSFAQGQQGQRPARPGVRGGGMGDMMYLERAWTACSFQLDCTAEQLEALRPTFRNALNERNQALAQAMQNRDFQAMRTAIQNCKTRLQTKLQDVLTDDQWVKLDGIMTRPMMGMGGPRPGGAGGGAGR